MLPIRMDMTRDQCRTCLRCLELDAYGNMVSVLRAQGSFTDDKKRLLSELAKVLHISSERHRAEIRRAVNDEKLSEIAEQLYGPNTWTDWAIEGRRTIPLITRSKAHTAFIELANSLSVVIATANAKKRINYQSNNNKNNQYFDDNHCSDDGDEVQVNDSESLRCSDSVNDDNVLPIDKNSKSTNCTVLSSQTKQRGKKRKQSLNEVDNSLRKFRKYTINLENNDSSSVNNVHCVEMRGDSSSLPTSLNEPIRVDSTVNLQNEKLPSIRMEFSSNCTPLSATSSQSSVSCRKNLRSNPVLTPDLDGMTDINHFSDETESSDELDDISRFGDVDCCLDGTKSLGDVKFTSKSIKTSSNIKSQQKIEITDLGLKTNDGKTEVGAKVVESDSNMKNVKEDLETKNIKMDVKIKNIKPYLETKKIVLDLESKNAELDLKTKINESNLDQEKIKADLKDNFKTVIETNLKTNVVEPAIEAQPVKSTSETVITEPTVKVDIAAPVLKTAEMSSPETVVNTDLEKKISEPVLEIKNVVDSSLEIKTLESTSNIVGSDIEAEINKTKLKENVLESNVEEKIVESDIETKIEKVHVQSNVDESTLKSTIVEAIFEKIIDETLPESLPETKTVSPVLERKSVSPILETKNILPIRGTKILSLPLQTKIISPLTQKKISSPTKIISPPLQIKIFSPTQETKILSPTLQTKIVSPPREINIVSPPLQTKIGSPLPEKSINLQNPPTLQTKIISPAQEKIIISKPQETQATSLSQEKKPVSPPLVILPSLNTKMVDSNLSKKIIETNVDKILIPNSSSKIVGLNIPTTIIKPKIEAKLLDTNSKSQKIIQPKLETKIVQSDSESTTPTGSSPSLQVKSDLVTFKPLGNISRSPMAKVGITLNSDKTVSLSSLPDIKLGMKKKVIVVQKGLSKTVKLSQEVLDRVKGGKNLCITRNSGSFCLRPHRPTTGNNGDQVPKMVTLPGNFVNSTLKSDNRILLNIKNNKSLKIKVDKIDKNDNSHSKFDDLDSNNDHINFETHLDTNNSCTEVNNLHTEKTNNLLTEEMNNLHTEDTDNSCSNIDNLQTEYENLNYENDNIDSDIVSSSIIIDKNSVSNAVQLNLNKEGSINDRNGDFLNLPVNIHGDIVAQDRSHIMKSEISNDIYINDEEQYLDDSHISNCKKDVFLPSDNEVYNFETNADNVCEIQTEETALTSEMDMFPTQIVSTGSKIETFSYLEEDTIEEFIEDDMTKRITNSELINEYDDNES